MAEQPGPGFGVLVRELRGAARLTQEELAQAAGVSPRTVSDLERGVTHTAHKDTAVLLAGGLGLAGPAVEMFVAAARGKASPVAVLVAAGNGEAQQLGLAGSPYQGLSVFEEQDAALFFGRDAATTQVLERMSRLLAGVGLLVVSGASGAGKSSLLRAGVLPRIQAGGLAAALGSASWPRVVLTPTRAPLDELALRVGVLAGVDAAAVRRGAGHRSGLLRAHRLASRPGGATRPGRGSGWPLGGARSAATAPVVAGGGPVRGVVHPVHRGRAAAGVHHRAARGRHRRARPRPGAGRAGGAGAARRF